MAVTKPSKIPSFSTSIDENGKGTITDAVSGQKNALSPTDLGLDTAEGWKRHSHLPRQVMNWFMGLTDKWIKWFDQEVDSLKGRMTAVEADGGDQSGRLDAIEAKNTAQDGRLTTNESDISANASDISTNESDILANETDISANTSKNATQDGRLTVIESKNTTQDGRLTAIESKNTTQDGDISGNTTAITANTTKNTSQDALIAGLVSWGHAQYKKKYVKVFTCDQDGDIIFANQRINGVLKYLEVNNSNFNYIMGDVSFSTQEFLVYTPEGSTGTLCIGIENIDGTPCVLSFLGEGDGQSTLIIGSTSRDDGSGNHANQRPMLVNDGVKSSTLHIAGYEPSDREWHFAPLSSSGYASVIAPFNVQVAMART